MKSLLILASVFTIGAAAPVFAANANHPYQNCDKKVDNCGPTGDTSTDQLNGQQLGGAPTTPAPSADSMPMNRNMAPRQ